MISPVKHEILQVRERLNMALKQYEQGYLKPAQAYMLFENIRLSLHDLLFKNKGKLTSLEVRQIVSIIEACSDKCHRICLSLVQTLDSHLTLPLEVRKPLIQSRPQVRGRAV